MIKSCRISLAVYSWFDVLLLSGVTVDCRVGCTVGCTAVVACAGRVVGTAVLALPDERSYCCTPINDVDASMRTNSRPNTTHRKACLFFFVGGGGGGICE